MQNVKESLIFIKYKFKTEIVLGRICGKTIEEIF